MRDVTTLLAAQWRIFWTMIDHDSHHGGEIGVLRDLFRSRAAGGSADRG